MECAYDFVSQILPKAHGNRMRVADFAILSHYILHEIYEPLLVVLLVLTLVESKGPLQ
jgi:hypothetical protein